MARGWERNSKRMVNGQWPMVNGQWSMRCPRAPSVFSSAHLCALCVRWSSYTDDGNGAAGRGTVTARIERIGADGQPLIWPERQEDSPRSRQNAPAKSHVDN